MPFGSSAPSGAHISPQVPAFTGQWRQGLQLACVPSQNGGVLVRLQTQNDFVPLSAALYFIGVICVTLCDPSQKGCSLLSPHAHHQYVLPDSTVTSTAALSLVSAVDAVVIVEVSSTDILVRSISHRAHDTM